MDRSWTELHGLRLSFLLLSVVKVPIRHRRKNYPYRAIRDAFGIVE